MIKSLWCMFTIEIPCEDRRIKILFTNQLEILQNFVIHTSLNRTDHRYIHPNIAQIYNNFVREFTERCYSADRLYKRLCIRAALIVRRSFEANVSWRIFFISHKYFIEYFISARILIFLHISVLYSFCVGVIIVRFEIVKSKFEHKNKKKDLKCTPKRAFGFLFELRFGYS